MAISCLVVHAIKMWLPSLARSWVPDRKQTYNHGQSPWDGTEVFIIFSNFWVPSWNSASFSKFSLSFPSPTLYKVETHKKKNSGYTSPTLFVGWGKRLGLCELENAPEMKSAPRFLTMIVAMTSQTPNGSFLHWDKEKFMKSEAILEILLRFVNGAYTCMCQGCRWLKSCRDASRVFFFLAFESSWWLSHLSHGTIAFEEFLLLLVVVENESVQ